MDIVTYAAAKAAGAKAARQFDAADSGKAMVVGADGVIAPATIAAGEVVIDDTLAIEGAAADSKTAGDRLEAAEDDIGTLLPANLLDGTTWTSGKFVAYDTGDLSNGSWQASDYIDVSGISRIVYSRIHTTSSSSKAGIAFYDENKEWKSGIRCVRNADTFYFEKDEAAVPEGAKYVRITIGSSIKGRFVYDASDYYAKIPARMDAAESDVAALKANLGTAHTTAQSNIAQGEYFCLNGTTLCQATAAIASGETITVGTNCQIATLDSVLNTLTAAIAALGE